MFLSSRIASYAAGRSINGEQCMPEWRSFFRLRWLLRSVFFLLSLTSVGNVTASTTSVDQDKSITFHLRGDSFVARSWFDESSGAWALSLSEQKPEGSAFVALNKLMAPKFSSSTTESFSLHSLQWTGEKIQITYLVNLERGNYRVAYYRLGVARKNGVWSIVDYATSYLYADKPSYSTTDGDLQTFKAMVCQEGGLFDCTSSVTTTMALEPMSLIPLEKFSSVTEFSIRPISNTLIR